MRPETANEITRNVLKVINYMPGCVAYRINNVGIWDEKKQVYRKANTEKGIPDVIACLHGIFVGIEVKAGNDKMSEDQQKRRFEIEGAKGFFIEARSTDDFLEKLKILNSKINERIQRQRT